MQKAIEILKPHAAAAAPRARCVFAINFSGQSLQDDELHRDFCSSVIEASGLNPAIFCFELTESAAVGRSARAEVLMRRLRRAGLRHRAG